MFAMMRMAYSVLGMNVMMVLSLLRKKLAAGY